MPKPLPVLLLSMLVASALAVTGCSRDTGDAGGELPAGERLEPVTAPQRIVAANNSALDLLLALVEPGRIVGIPADAHRYASGDISAATSFERYRGEDILVLQPDLVVTHWWQDIDTTTVLRNAEVPVLALPALQTFDDLEAIIGLMATAVDARERGEQLLADLATRRAVLSADTSRRHVGVMSYVNFGSGGWTAGSQTSLHVVIGLAGMRNVAAEAGRVGNDRIDIEELLLLDPDVIVVDGTPDDPGTSARYLLDEPSLRHLTALKRQRLVYLPPNLQSTVSHLLLDAAEELARRIDVLDPASIGRDG